MKFCTIFVCILLFAITTEGGSSCTNDSSCKRSEKCLQNPETNQYKCVKTKCTEPAVTGRCRANHQRYYFDPNTFQCKLFVYGGCGQNGNNFRSQAQCMKKCLHIAENTKQKRT
ncbi:hypothetical protein CHS0354_043163 [Potamilus streckersoni]|uniref:BPTI/Kunitz inhibitor domain-containing protein n=1 Tax=Potamilus streckersoni TaxID=2493646 RepID=A0AAE0VYR0_9BIVA|nr:hypothetical protein CHS0354_043163 [Potamilus streckersoni]